MSKVQDWLSQGQEVYISITGLQVKKPWQIFAFFWHAIPSKRQAERAEGNLSVAVKTINGVHHTLTTWKSEQDMRKYLYSGAHQKAIRAFRKIATGKTFGLLGREVPDWNKVHELWRERAKEY